MEEEDHFTQTQLPLLPHCCTRQQAAALGSPSLSLLFSHVLFSAPSLCSQIIASFIGKHGEPLQHICQHGGVNKALNHGMNCGTIHASTCLVVGYCHKWQYPNSGVTELLRVVSFSGKERYLPYYSPSSIAFSGCFLGRCPETNKMKQSPLPKLLLLNVVLRVEDEL